MIPRYLKLLLLTLQVSLFVPIFVGAASYYRLHKLNWESGFVIQIVIMAIIAALVALILQLFSGKVLNPIKNIAREQAEFLRNLPETTLAWGIITAAGLSLYLELGVIRWLATVFPVFALYKNFSLLACFAGLGLGYTMSDRRSIPLVLVLPVLLWLILFILYSRYGLAEEHVTLITGLTPITERWAMGLERVALELTLLPLHVFMSVTFMLTALIFVPIGQLCGCLMERRAKLKAYGFNLLGSLLGVGLIFVISYFWLPPTAWFALAFALLLIFQTHRPKILALAAISALVCVMALSWPVAPLTHHVFSPYQNIDRTANRLGLLQIAAAGHFYQNIHNLSFENANRETNEWLRTLTGYYELPYKVHPKPTKVAIVGAGTGNDVAAAVRMGAGQIDAIEIDPVILDFGRAYHPEKPYGQKQVNPILNDARTFFRTTDQRYDMVVYGLLDSHTLLSHASSVRLDSFVYTVEGLREARDCLTENGTLCLSFVLLGKEMGRKLYLMMQEAFDGNAPVCLKAGENKYVFIQNNQGNLSLPPDLLERTGFKQMSGQFSQASIRADVSTDDWPFLYMPYRRFPVSFLPMAFMVFALSWLLSRMTPGRIFERGNLVFFLLGAGFMLVETKAITELGLTFGNTWHVIGIAISGILFMAFWANYAVDRFKLDQINLPFILLLASLGVGYAVSLGGGFPSTIWGRLAAAVLLTCPMFFAGILFSTLLRRGGEISGVMAANLLGAMLGGLLEYNSMYFGFSFLYLLAAALYGGAWLLTRVPRFSPGG